LHAESGVDKLIYTVVWLAAAAQRLALQLGTGASVNALHCGWATRLQNALHCGCAEATSGTPCAAVVVEDNYNAMHSGGIEVPTASLALRLA
jgi:hypothetical protein